MDQDSPQPDAFSVALGHRIRDMRKKAGLTQAEVCEKYAFGSQLAISRLESASLRSISFDQLSRLVRFAEDCGKSAA